MKKMLFGALLLLCGIIGLIVFVTLSVIHPWNYNNITGLLGFLLGTETILIFIIFLLMAIGGITICIYEAYIRK